MKTIIKKWHRIPYIDWDLPKPVEALICAIIVFAATVYFLGIEASTAAAIVSFILIMTSKKR